MQAAGTLATLIGALPTAANVALIRKNTDVIDARGTVTSAQLDVLLLALCNALTTYDLATGKKAFLSPDGVKKRIEATLVNGERTAVANDFS